MIFLAGGEAVIIWGGASGARMFPTQLSITPETPPDPDPPSGPTEGILEGVQITIFDQEIVWEFEDA